MLWWRYTVHPPPSPGSSLASNVAVSQRRRWFPWTLRLPLSQPASSLLRLLLHSQWGKCSPSRRLLSLLRNIKGAQAESAPPRLMSKRGGGWWWLRHSSVAGGREEGSRLNCCNREFIFLLRLVITSGLEAFDMETGGSVGRRKKVARSFMVAVVVNNYINVSTCIEAEVGRVLEQWGHVRLQETHQWILK